MSNRLAGETSPYLLQHRDNPVDWYPWIPEALERARTEDKPILLSVGYAACHWCHVMERESFEDEETARLMNENFVSIKVDREERPDIDAIYMEAVQAMTGQGGWPMTVFLTPDGAPFFGGTYFPPDDRHGLPSFKRLLIAVADAWRERRSDAMEQGRRLADALDPTARLKPSTEPISDRLLTEAFENLQRSFDASHGGFGGAPKFPQAMVVDLLMSLGGPGADEIAETTLEAMARGGIFDQLGGGFHRYSVDRTWTVPHFEKMLYDNAQLLRSYARSWQRTKNERRAATARGTAAWMLREMRDPAGGFWSSLDADSEGEEGRFYVWDLDEVREVAGDVAEIALRRWGFTETGNFEGKNIPIDAAEEEDPAATERAQRALLQRRDRRERPATDDKVLTAWNALAASALAEAGSILSEPEWVAAAERSLRFALTTLRVDGRLMRSYRNGVVKHLGFCEDYAYTLEACLALYEATFDVYWIEEATWAADEAIRLFGDEEGGFFTTGNDAERLIARSKDLVDNAMPAANSVMALQLQRLASLTGNASYEERAVAAMRLVRDAMPRSPLGFGHLLQAVDLYSNGAIEVVLIADPAGPDASDFVDLARDRYLPRGLLVSSIHPEKDAQAIPLLRGRSATNGMPTAYVCRRGVCKMPVTTADDLLRELDAT